MHDRRKKACEFGARLNVAQIAPLAAIAWSTRDQAMIYTFKKAGDHMSRIVVVSNRVADPNKPAAGGLAVAVRECLRRTGGLWFGWSGRIVEKTNTHSGHVHASIQASGNIQLATVDLDRQQYETYYSGYSNNVLWPVFHYRLDLAQFDKGFAAGYRQVNRLFAQQLFRLLRPDDIIWVHDYHLIPIAAELRAMGCENRIGFFLHIPVPPPLIIAAIPEHEWLMRSLFCYDLIGVQAKSDLTHLVRYMETEARAERPCDGVLCAFGRELRVGAFPIGIDVGEFTALADSRDSKDMYATIRDEYSRRELLVGVDRLDYSKGLPQRVRAFRALLDSYPENRSRATLIQIAAPSREDVNAYDDLRQEMDSLCGAINGDYGELDWMPIRYIRRSVARRRLPGLYRASRVAMVTPLRDGMNLVAKEFLAAQDPGDPGVLVLSRFAGAAEQLTEALHVNPYDIQGIAQAMQRALTMSLKERVSRHAALMDSIRRYDVHWWRATFLEELKRTTGGANALQGCGGVRDALRGALVRHRV